MTTTQPTPPPNNHVLAGKPQSSFVDGRALNEVEGIWVLHAALFLLPVLPTVEKTCSHGLIFRNLSPFHLYSEADLGLILTARLQNTHIQNTEGHSIPFYPLLHEP